MMFCHLILAHIINKCPFCGLFSGTFSAFSCFLLVILLLKMAPKYGAAVLSAIPKHKKAVMSLIKKTLDKLWSGVSYTAVGHEFNVN